MQSVPTVFMRSPQGEIKEIEATAAALTPLMVAGWYQVMGPAKAAPAKPAATAPAKEEK